MQVYGISTDDVASQAKFVKEQELNFKLLSDPDGGVATKYGVLGGRGYNRRITFVVDEEGMLLHVDDGVKVSSHGEDLVALVREIK